MKNIVVAGGTDGIGLAFVKELDADAYKTIYVIGRDFSKVRSLGYKNLVALHCDVTRQREVIDAVSKIHEPVDQFVNTIGTFYKGAAESMDPEDVARHFAVNSIGNINLTNQILKKLNRQHAEILVCSASLALEARENYALQSATKVAYKYYLEALQKEKGQALKVMIIYPGSVDTDVFKKAGDMRDTSSYIKPAQVAHTMHSMLNAQE